MKKSNQYARAFGPKYAKIPKSVFAAVAFSYANWACGEEAKTDEEAISRFMKEWHTLYDNGIVSQKPRASAPGEKSSNG